MKQKTLIIVGVIVLIFVIFQSTCSKNDEPNVINQDNNPEIVTNQGDVEEVIKKEKTIFEKLTLDEENSQMNVNTGGIIARNENYYYFAESAFGNLYKCDINGENLEKLNSKMLTSSINIINGNIYYINLEYKYDEQNDMYINMGGNISKQNTNSRIPFRSNIRATKLLVYENEIYFTNADDNNSIYVSDLNLENYEKISSVTNVIDIFCLDGQIIFRNNEAIYKVNIKDKAQRIIMPATDIKQFAYNNRNYYYLKANGYLYLARNEEVQKVEQINKNVESFFVNVNNLYYKSKSKIKAYNIDTGETIEKGNINSRNNNFAVLGDVIFYSEETQISRFLDIAGYDSRMFNYIKEESNKYVYKSYPIYSQENEFENYGFDMDGAKEYLYSNYRDVDRSFVINILEDEIYKFFKGNTCIYQIKQLDLDNDKINELVVIGLKYNYEIQKKEEYVTAFKFDNDKFTKFSDIRLKNLSRTILGNIIGSVNINAVDYIPRGIDELAVHNSGNTKKYDLFKVYLNSFEVIALDRKEEREIQKNGFGNKILE